MADKKISQLTASTTPLAGTEELPVVQSGVTKKVSVANLTAGRDVAMATANVGGGTAISGVAATLGNNTGAPTKWGLVSLENCGGIAPPSNAGLMVGWNYSNGGGETNLVYGTGLGGAPALAIARFDGVTLSESGRFTSAGNLAFPSGQGIDFSADPSAAGMTSELLDDYEEGTWTPTLAFTSGSVTYVTQLGTYTKIGNQVTVNYWIRVNTVSSPSGATYVASLPFNSGATGTRPAAAIRVNNFAITGYCVGWLSTSTNQILLNDIQSGNAVTIDGSKVVGNTEIGGSFTYLVA